MTTAYRISRWVELPSSFKGIRFRKALTAMSVGAVDAQWMSTHAHLSPQEQSALLKQLRHEGVLAEVAQPLAGVRAEPFFVQQRPRPLRRRGLLADVEAWLLAGEPAARARRPS
ncbi:hypothetical protein [Methylibium rhizosphaerae]|uniref:hypothetical protein n=1 Tax=Methylibium rhizosphaerae TaxID=2570323 RepID=UPI001126DAA3|nr:hypothetical protein [Methylibium rhizosphaerae]